jgi:hypothetical protein
MVVYLQGWGNFPTFAIVIIKQQQYDNKKDNEVLS